MGNIIQSLFYSAYLCSEKTFIARRAVNSISDLQDLENYRGLLPSTYFVYNLRDNETAEKCVINTEVRIN